MGLLNWFQNDPEKQAALRQGLLSAGAAMMGNQNPSFLGAAGQGAMAGMQGYQDYFGNQQKQAYNKAMSDAAMANAMSARMRALAEAEKAKKDNDEDELAGNVFKTLFEERGYSPETGQFMQVSNDSIPVQLPVAKSGVQSPVMQPETESPVLGSLADPSMSYVPPQPPNPMDEVLGELNWTPGRKKMFEAQYKANPASAMKALQAAYVELDRANRKGRTEARDVLAKERAIQDEIDKGTSLGQRLGAPKQPLVQNINYGSPTQGLNPTTGKVEFIQFPNKPGVQPIFTGIEPGKSAEQQESQRKQSIGVKNLQGAIGEYLNTLSTWNKMDTLSPDARAKMGLKYNNMMLQAKEAYNLGVLNGPDFEILTSVITDPRSFVGAITSNEALGEQARELSRIMGNVGAVVTSEPKFIPQGKRTAPQQSAPDPLGIRK